MARQGWHKRRPTDGGRQRQLWFSKRRWNKCVMRQSHEALRLLAFTALASACRASRGFLSLAGHSSTQSGSSTAAAATCRVWSASPVGSHLCHRAHRHHQHPTSMQQHQRLRRRRAGRRPHSEPRPSRRKKSGAAGPSLPPASRGPSIVRDCGLCVSFFGPRSLTPESPLRTGPCCPKPETARNPRQHFGKGKGMGADRQAGTAFYARARFPVEGLMG
ncbi:hypothetical protein VFPFJ_00315 [Purpureocillium lilacinum]|uniref:Uncharacterized protein n=1 Tax=Purpureocillium lilacinum TaxID=33203 RepID=A0A179HUN5_PURLI|nr:hypothetical protein VFPFJ_00315 [Purpureocillium lilacinum]OAQ86245.1 hypothetical protein VFPBJ_00285 [Purpureocillium lilacinum]OAQ94206.1 hypothetical protein VFPFJ_00315 [Purpureocillium lilacinum]